MTAQLKPVERRVVELKDRSLLVDRAYVAGEWIAAADGRSFAVTDPFDGAPIVEVPALDASAARRAIDAAAEVQKDWAKRPAKERSRILKAWYDLIVDNADDLALILTTEQGKPLAEAKAEVLSNAAYIEWFAEEAKRIDGDVIPGAAPNQRILVLKQPVGVCAAITPWNFPNGMITRKVGPALAAGCTMVLKPAAQTPLSALALGRAGRARRCAEGRVLGDHHRRCQGDRGGVLPQPEGGQDHLHRLDRGRALADEGGGGRDQAAVARARRQCAVHRVRRCRSRCGGRGRDGLEVPQCRPDLRLRQPDLRPGERGRGLCRKARRQGQGAQARARHRGRRDAWAR